MLSRFRVRVRVRNSAMVRIWGHHSVVVSIRVRVRVTANYRSLLHTNACLTMLQSSSDGRASATATNRVQDRFNNHLLNKSSANPLRSMFV